MPLPKTSDTGKKSSSGLLARLGEKLAATRHAFSGGHAGLFGGTRPIDGALLEELETLLLGADLGLDTTRVVLDKLTARAGKLADSGALAATLKEVLLAILAPCDRPLAIPAAGKPFVILMVGVNGAGKTTTIGKLAHKFQAEGRKVMLAAGDTFRAAAVEQLQAWGERNAAPVIAQAAGADAAAVAHDHRVGLEDHAARLRHFRDLHVRAQRAAVRRHLAPLSGRAAQVAKLQVDRA